MSDGFFDENQVVAVQNILKQQQQDLKDRRFLTEQDEYMENIYDFHKFTANPKLTRLTEKLKEIDKNWVFGNYNAKDEQVILGTESLLSDLDVLLPKLDITDSNIKSSLLRDIFSRITISRGRKGFAAKLFVTQIGFTKAEVSGLDKKKAGIFNLKRR